MFTKAEIEKLSVEQREVLAKFEFSEAKRRRELLEEAHGYHDSWHRHYLRQSVVVWFAVGVFIFFLWHSNEMERSYALYILCGLAVVDLLVGLRIARVNRRLDALLELLEFDRQHQNERDVSKE